MTRKESQEQLEKLLYADLQDGRFKEMREYLEQVKGTFENYDKWIRVIEQEEKRRQ